MIKLIIFDLDGVLVETKDSHFHALNQALGDFNKNWTISYQEHLQKYDALPTKKKLEKLHKEKEVPENLFDIIWKKKQEYTLQVLKNTIYPNLYISDLFRKLKEEGFKIWVASNSIKQTIKIVLLRMNLFEYVDGYVSNEDVKNGKPNPEMYLKAMISESISPKETLIIEDSFIGHTAVFNSGAWLCNVKNPNEVTIQTIYSRLNNINTLSLKPKWEGGKMNILIPMAGAGSRFEKAGYTFPKPLINVRNKTMIQMVVDNLNISGRYIFVVQKSHNEQYHLKTYLNTIAPGCEVVEVNGVTEGAACTCLLAKEFINNNEPLLIANSDQFVEWNSGDFMYQMVSSNVDGGILTFESTHPKWSYVKLDEQGYVTEIKEKVVISNHSTVGIYYWGKGKDFVTSAEEMIKKDLRVGSNFNGKGEFYVAPTYTEMISKDQKIKTYDVQRQWGTGTPEDLDYFINNYKGTL